MKKNLNADALVLDLRHLTEETLSSYENITLNATVTLTNPAAQALLSRYNVKLDTMASCNVPDEVRASVVNGKTTLTAADKPEKRQVLVVNGKVTLTPDAADTLRQYEAIVLNGKACCPQSLASLFHEVATINGKLVTYPDEAVVLSGRSVKLDRTFLLRAKNCLYWTERMFVAVDPKLDAAALAAKGCRFTAPKALLSESLAEPLAQLFSDDTELVILPDGTAVVDDDLDLTAASSRSYGSRLYVLGDVTFSDDCADALRKLEFFHVSGTVTLPAALEEAFYAIPDAAFDDLRILSGHLLHGLPLLKLTNDFLTDHPEGIACIDCACVTLDEALLPDDIAKRCQFDGCALIRCSERQQNAVASVSRNVAQIMTTGQKDGPLNGLFDANTTSLNALQLTL